MVSSMKNYYQLLLSSVILWFCCGVLYAQNSTILPGTIATPQMTNAQIMAIPNPQAGMLAFDTDAQCLRLYTSPSGWMCLGMSTTPGVNGWSVSGFFPTLKDIAVTANAIYLVGTYSYGTGASIPNSSGGEDGFVAKYDLAGTLVWFKKTGGVQTESVNSIDVVNNEIFVAGTFTGSITLGNSPLTSAGDKDVFVAKLDDAGNWAWAVRMGGASPDEAKAVVAVRYANNQYGATVCGSFSVMATFGSSTFTSAGITDAFVTDVDAAGAIIGTNAFGGAGTDVANDIFYSDIVAYASNMIVVGTFEQSMTVGSQSLTSAGGKDGFIVGRKGTTLASYLTRRFGGTGEEEATKIAGWGINDATNISGGRFYVLGTFTGTANFPASGVNSVSATSNGGTDVFNYIVEFNNFGNYYSGLVQSMGGTGNETVSAAMTKVTGTYTTSVIVAGTATAGFIFGSSVVPAGTFVAHWQRPVGGGSWAITGTSGTVVGLGQSNGGMYGAVNGSGVYGNININPSGVIKFF